MPLLNRAGGRILEAKNQFPRDIVQVESLRHGYRAGGKSLEVLKDISWTIQSGQIVSLMGPSGAGKSTLLHILGLMEQAQSGRLNILGWDAQTLKEREKDNLRARYLGFMFQFHYLLPELTLLENVMLPQRILELPAKLARENAMELLSAVNLGARAAHYPSELSGGEQQRGALCRAMINRPAILICDEPTGNLDLETGEEVRQLIWRLARAYHTTAILATHNAELAKTADRRVKIVDGKIVQDELL